MRRFECPDCASEVWFDSIACEACGGSIAYELVSDSFVPAEAWCANRETEEACNWATAAHWCASCELDVDHVPDALAAPFQRAKRRTLRQLTRAGIDPAVREPKLRFEIRSSSPERPVTTGHADGLITLDSAEAEPETLERIRVELGEPYRTPLGHVRHEIGHWWWQSALGTELHVDRFRKLFGDERRDYTQALADHYASVDDGSWGGEFISFYAASHPWEDFAESFAHVLHVTDTYETAVASGFADELGSDAAFDVVLEHWGAVALRLNELNRSMGTPDPYPFVVSPPAAQKLVAVAATFPSAAGPGAMAGGQGKV